MIRRLLAPALFALFAALGPAPALRAQDNATLVADSVRLEGERRLVAEGNVEVFHDGTRLTASRILYDGATDRLQIEGPLRYSDGSDFVLLGDSADLDRTLTDGILTSARLVLAEQFQVAAPQAERIDGRFTQLSRAVASSCQVCPNRPTPLWEIRARRVTHDREGGQIYFEGAQFRVAGLPIAYLPRLRLPDSSVDRVRGFLIPELKITSLLGTGLKLPWFLPIGIDRDLTFTPYVASNTRTLDLRYRQAFRNGSLTLTGAVSQDDLRDGLRGYIAATGAFSLPRGFGLSFESTLTSDRAYLSDYDISDEDRLPTRIVLSRVRRDELIASDVIFYRSLREGAAAEDVPLVLGTAEWVRRFDGPGPGRGGLRFSASGIGYDGNPAVPGSRRDTLRLTAQADWRADVVLRNGMVVSGLADLALDGFAIGDDPAYPSTVTRALPTLAAELRWPLARTEASGAVQVLEPVAQLIWAPDDLPDVPNVDSTVVEFGEGNLFTFSRFPGSDLRELGPRANLGLTWTRIDPEGWSARIGGGRVFRSDDLGQFSATSGLAGLRSDWLLAAQVDTGTGLRLTNRALLGEEFGIVRDELRMDWTGARTNFAASYIWIEAEPAENRPEDSAEFFLDGGFSLTDNWTGSLEARYDFSAARVADAGLGLRYDNECVGLGLSLSRRFTSSASVEPNTEVALQVALNGFGTGNDGRRYRKSCGF